MFRFSIRDLLWLTLVVALALGWFVRERQLWAEVDHTKRTWESFCQAHAEQIRAWQRRTGALEYAAKQDGWEVVWDLEASEVHVIKREGLSFTERTIKFERN